MIVAIVNGNQGCLDNWFNPCCQGNNSVLFKVKSGQHVGSWFNGWSIQSLVQHLVCYL